MPVPPVAPMPMGDPQGQEPELDENGQPIDPSMVDPNAQVPQDPSAMPPQEGDPNAPPVEGDPNAEGEDGSPPPTPYYYNDEDDEPDGDEEYPDPTGQGGVQKSMEPLATDTNILSKLMETAVAKALGIALVPYTAKINELIASNGELTSEVTTLKSVVTEQMDVIKGLQTQTTDVSKALDAEVPPAAPDAPEATDTDVTKALGDDATQVDPASVASPGGGAEGDNLIPKASKLLREAKSMRDSITKSWANDDAKTNLVKALSTVQSGKVNPDTLKALETAIEAAK